MEQTFTKTQKAIINKVRDGKELTEKQQEQLNKLLKEMELPQGQQEGQQEEQTEQKALTLENWKELTEEQQEELKGALIKSKYGIGGEQFSTFPTLLGTNKENTWINKEYNLNKLPSRVTEQTFKNWTENGTVTIIPMEIGTTIQYLVTILPNKEIQTDLWNLENGTEKPYTRYTNWNKVGTVTLDKTNFLITNIYTNKNKAYNQGKQLIKLFQIGGNNFKTLELQKELKTNYYKKELTKDGKIILQEIGKNNHQPTGKTFNNLEELFNREQHKELQFNYLENIQ